MEFIARDFWRNELDDRKYTAQANHTEAAREDFKESWQGCDSVPRWLMKQLDTQDRHRLMQGAENRLRLLGLGYVFGGDTPAKRRTQHVQTILADLTYVEPDTINGLESPSMGV